MDEFGGDDTAYAGIRALCGKSLADDAINSWWDDGGYSKYGPTSRQQADEGYKTVLEHGKNVGICGKIYCD